MNTEFHTLSAVRQKSSFASPPRVLVVADGDNPAEALALAEALDAFGAEAEVRLAEDTTADEYGDPDAVILAGAGSGKRAHDYLAARSHPVLVAVTDAKDRGEPWRTDSGFDLVVNRPVNASSLMQRLGSYLARM